MAGRGVEVAAAGDDPERRVIGRGVDFLRREFVLGVFANAGDAEDGRYSVGQRYVNLVTRAQRAKWAPRCSAWSR